MLGRAAPERGSLKPVCEEGFHLPFLPQVFWLAGSLLIIGLASVVIPTIGWRWLIRIASIPGIILILAFKVRKLPGLPPSLPAVVQWPLGPFPPLPFI